jgi:hypothetical protein
VLGAVLPSLLFVISWIVLLNRLVPMASHLFLPLVSLDKEWRVLATSLITLLIAGLLYNLNSPIIRLYEGYPWKDSTLGRRLIERQMARLKKAKQLRARLRYICDFLEAAHPASARISPGRERQTRLARIVNNDFPSDGALVLPTRLGNVIRNFELYPTVQFGMSAIAFWPRIIAKIDDRYAQTIDSAKASFDFMINASALSAITALCVLFLGVLSQTRLGLNTFTLGWLLRLAGFTVLSWLAYEGSIIQARDWGAQVKGAFDLYRFDLLKQLGYESKPHDRHEEKAIWAAITQKTVFPDMPREPQPSYSAERTRVLSSPAWMRMRVLRSITLEQDCSVTVTLRILNLEARRDARGVIALDTIDDAMDYVESSVECGERGGSLLSTRPFAYRMPQLSHGSSTTVRYKLVQIAKK